MVVAAVNGRCIILWQKRYAFSGRSVMPMRQRHVSDQCQPLHCHLAKARSSNSQLPACSISITTTGTRIYVRGINIAVIRSDVFEYLRTEPKIPTSRTRSATSSASRSRRCMWLRTRRSAEPSVPS